MSLQIKIAAAAALLALSSCRAGWTLDSIRYGYPDEKVESRVEAPSQDQLNDAQSGFGPSVDPKSDFQLTGWETGSPVGQSPAGVVTQTSGPINPGLESGPFGDGSRSTLLDRYQEAVEQTERLQQENDDLSAFLVRTEESLLVATQELTEVKALLEELSTVKTQVEQENFDLAARLATAQIARLEAERSLLEATIEWRAMNARNNDPKAGSNDLQANQVR